MKKLFTIATALLIATSAFAQEEKKGPEFTYGARAWAFGAMIAQKNFQEDYSAVRIRPLLSVGMDDTKIVTQLELSQVFGRKGSDISKDKDAGYAGPATDNTAVRIKEAYLESKNVIIPGLSLTAGLKGYKFPWAIDNDFALFTVGYDFGMGQANLSYIKINEGTDIIEQKVNASGVKTKQNEDAQVYLLDVPVKVDKDITIRPAVMYIQGGKDYIASYETTPANWREYTDLYKTSLYNVALNATAKIDIISVNVTGAYLTGTLNEKAKDPTDPSLGFNKIDTSAYLFDLGVDVKATDMIKVGAFFTYSSGNDGKKPDKENNNYFKNMENIFGRPEKADGVNAGRLFVLEAASLTRNGGNYEYFFAMDLAEGYMSYGINAEAKIDKLTLFAQFGMASTTEDRIITDLKTGNSKKVTSIGSEIDVRVSYALASRTSLFLECGYVLAGDIQFNTLNYATTGEQVKPENMYQIAWGITSQI